MGTFQLLKRVSQKNVSFCKSKVLARFLSLAPHDVTPDAWTRPFQAPQPEFDWEYLCDEKNKKEIEENICNRKGVGDVSKMVIKILHANGINFLH